MAITKLTVPGPTSGSLGGITFSHNRGGAYMRVRATPTNPNTVQQQAVRSAMASLATRWNDILSAAQRAAWDTYAFNVPLPNALGDPVNVGGVGMFMRSNVPRIQVALPIVDDGPTLFNLGEMGTPTILSVTATTNIASIGFVDTDEWVDEDDSALLIYNGRSQNPGINFFKGPYQFADKVVGDAITPPTTPAAIGLKFVSVVGNNTFLRIRVTRADGRLSAEFRGGIEAE